MSLQTIVTVQLFDSRSERIILNRKRIRQWLSRHLFSFPRFFAATVASFNHTACICQCITDIRKLAQIEGSWVGPLVRW